MAFAGGGHRLQRCGSWRDSAGRVALLHVGGGVTFGVSCLSGARGCCSFGWFTTMAAGQSHFSRVCGIFFQFSSSTIMDKIRFYYKRDRRSCGRGALRLPVSSRGSEAAAKGLGRASESWKGSPLRLGWHCKWLYPQ